MIDLESTLQALGRAKVQFIIVGGVAGTIHGSARLTRDLDVVYARTPENIAALAAALAPYRPYLRGAPPGLPFRWDADTIRRGLNFALTTELGDLDLLGEVTGGGSYEDLLPYCRPVSVFGETCQCVSLSRLIHLKRAAGRPRDLDAIAELEACATGAQTPTGDARITSATARPSSASRRRGHSMQLSAPNP